MLEWIRGRFGPALVTIIIGFIAFVFIFFGVYSPRSTRGMHEGAVAGKVNGEPISVAEFNRELNRRIELYRQITGGQFSEKQIRDFKLREGVFDEIVNRKLMTQEAQRLGLQASDAEVRAKIQEIPAFQKSGKFDATQYRQVLEANSMTPAGFERLMREDLSAQKWGDYFKRRVSVSDAELLEAVQLQKERRNVRFVQITPESARKGIVVQPEQISKYLSEPKNVSLLKAQFESRKDIDFKGKTYEQVARDLARDELASEQGDAARALMDRLADQALEAMRQGSAGRAKLDQLLKPYGLQAKETGWFTRADRFVPQIGEAPDLMEDAFAGGLETPKKYSQPMWRVVAVVSATEHAPTSLAALGQSATEPPKAPVGKAKAATPPASDERTQLRERIGSRKERELFEGWLKRLLDRADVVRNPDVVSGGAGGA